MNTHVNTKRIARNTLLLYFRMFITMIIGLYTSRVILQNLGVEDFGIYNVVGGVVAMFGLLSGSLSAATSRFFTFELGANNHDNLIKIFSTAITIQILLAFVIIIIAEFVGTWFLNNKMDIPFNRIYAANWVFQLSLIAFVVHLICIPYNAAIIAHERMSAFACISIIEAFCKLAVAWIIVFFSSDKLIIYSVLISSVALTIFLFYVCYCKRHFKECSYHFILDKPLLMQMFSFAGWNFIGASSAILRDQGGNIILNLFFGPSVNAARGIALQVQSAINQFATNIMTAVNPQITKSFANGNHTYMMFLIHQAARLSFYMLLFLSLPIILNADYILSIWLKLVPRHTIQFVQLSLIFILSESISAPLITAMLATGNIKKYQIVVGGLQMLNLPLSYILLKNGFVPESVFITAIVISQCCFFARLILLKKMISLKVVQYLKNVYFKVVIVSILSASIPLLVKKYIFIENNATNFITTTLICLICSSTIIGAIGSNSNERTLIKNKILMLKKRFICI